MSRQVGEVRTPVSTSAGGLRMSSVSAVKGGGGDIQTYNIEYVMQYTSLLFI